MYTFETFTTMKCCIYHSMLHLHIDISCGFPKDSVERLHQKESVFFGHPDTEYLLLPK